MSESSDRGTPGARVLVSSPRDDVRQVTLNRPDRLNAMDLALIDDLHTAFDDIERDRTARVVVITGSGRGFCAGADLNGYGDLGQFADLGPAQRGFALQKRIASLVVRLRSLPQPVIAAVNGPAAGGGLALVLGSDIRLASTSATFGVAFVRIGLSGCDLGTSWILPRLIGAGRAHEMMLTGRVVDADEAARIGLVLDVVDERVLLETALQKAAEIAANSPFGIALTKEAMWTALEIPGLQAVMDLENRQQLVAGATEDQDEAVRAFVERRAPQFKNR